MRAEPTRLDICPGKKYRDPIADRFSADIGRDRKSRDSRQRNSIAAHYWGEEKNMIWISRGRGGWALGIPLLCVFLPALADSEFSLLPKTPRVFGWVFAALGLASGLITIGVGFYLNRGPGFWTIDPATGMEQFDTSAKHSLYYIPMQYWGFLYFVLALFAGVLSR